MNFLRHLALQKKKMLTARVSMLLKSRASLTCFRACFLPGRAKELSAPRYVGTAWLYCWQDYLADIFAVDWLASLGHFCNKLIRQWPLSEKCFLPFLYITIILRFLWLHGEVNNIKGKEGRGEREKTKRKRVIVWYFTSTSSVTWCCAMKRRWYSFSIVSLMAIF